MSLFDPDIAHIGEVHIVGLLSRLSCVNVLARFAIVNFLRGSDDVIMLAYLEHSEHHVQILIEVVTSVCTIDQMRLLVQQVLR